MHLREYEKNKVKKIRRSESWRIFLKGQIILQSRSLCSLKGFYQFDKLEFVTLLYRK